MFSFRATNRVLLSCHVRMIWVNCL